MPTQTLGKVKLTPRGAYDPAATYVPLDIVSYGGGSYCVLKNVTGVTPTGDDVNYQLLAESGADGKSPQISTSKTWLVWDANKGEYVDTGVSAAGEKGDDGDPGKAPIIGSNGNWYEWDDSSGAYTDTGKPSRGEKGNTGAEGADGADGRDGITPTIGENGNWYLGETDTGKPSRGEDGATGATGATGEKGTDGKSAYQYAQDGGYTGTEAEFAAKLAKEKFANPYALTFTGAATGSYDGSEAMTVEIPNGGGGESFELLYDITLTEAAGSFLQDIPACKKAKMLIFPNASSSITGFKKIFINGVSYPTSNTSMPATQALLIEIDTVEQPKFRAYTGVFNDVAINGAAGIVSIGYSLSGAPTEIHSLGCNTAAMLNAGAIIKIWGIKV